MIGIKSLSAVAFAALMLAIAGARGVLHGAYLASLSGGAWFAVGVVASLACALLAIGWRFTVTSHTGVTVSARRLELVEHAEAVRELPAGVQHALVLAGIIAIVLPALGNHAVARLVQLPDDLVEPSPSAYCLDQAGSSAPKTPAEVRGPKPEAPPQPGCALVRRAVQLGYAKSLGSCAPKVEAPTPAAATAARNVCTRRHLDEPYMHYAYRRLAEFFGGLRDKPLGDAIARDEQDVRVHLDYRDDLLADVRHAITGTPHASHHIWVNLPDPHPVSVKERLTGIPRCSTRFANLPLWPALHDRSELVEHVLGQLLFASRFGTTASCNDYTIHWGAPVDACAKLAADPRAFLARDDGLASVRAVLDRRRRQLAIIELDRKLGRTLPVAPPPVSAIVSLQCLAIDKAGKPTASSVTLDGEQLAVRELHVAAIRTDADGPIDVYLALAALLGGTDLLPPSAPEQLETSRFPLLALDELVETDPFAGARWPLVDPALASVFPFEHHLHAFVERFRRRYVPQRGRL